MAVKRAVLSVWDKRGVVDLARGLRELGVEILSTGGTAAALAEAGIPFTPVESWTGFPEMMGGRVKTLHPHVHGAILARRDHPGDMADLERMGIGGIDLVVVNLYPFRETAWRLSREADAGQQVRGQTAALLEQIDIGGPAMVRAAAKNFPHVAVVVDPERYGRVLEELREKGDLSMETRWDLAVEAFRHTAFYDAVVAEVLAAWSGRSAGAGGNFPPLLTLAFERRAVLRYGENPHQRAAFYADPFAGPPEVAAAEQLQGKELSFNNLLDAQAAWALVREFAEPAAVVVKHQIPCGAALAGNAAEAFRRARDADPVSAFGGIVAFNRPVDEETARELGGVFLEVVAAPDFTSAAREILGKRRQLRLLRCGESGSPGEAALRRRFDFRRLEGGMLVQDPDEADTLPEKWQVVTSRRPEAGDIRELEFAWKVAKHVRSNAVVVARDGVTLGIGAGQTSRVAAARLALERAGERAGGAYLASDGFFPFPDVVEEAARAGIRAIVQPGGSVRDTDSIEAAERAGLVMVFTGVRHFRH